MCNTYYTNHYFIEGRKDTHELFHLSSDLALWLNLSGSNYPCLEHISMVPNLFEPLECPYIYCYLFSRPYVSLKLQYLPLQWAVSKDSNSLIVTNHKSLVFIEAF